jgi:hypothetical protein
LDRNAAMTFCKYDYKRHHGQTHNKKGNQAYHILFGYKASTHHLWQTSHNATEDYY